MGEDKFLEDTEAADMPDHHVDKLRNAALLLTMARSLVEEVMNETEVDDDDDDDDDDDTPTITSTYSSIRLSLVGIAHCLGYGDVNMYRRSTFYASWRSEAKIYRDLAAQFTVQAAVCDNTAENVLNTSLDTADGNE